jgi:hypothetical protein
MQVTRIALRSLYPDKLRIGLPVAFIEKMGLRAGDYVDLIQENGDVRLRFIKVDPPAELGPAPQGQLAEAS